VKSFYRIFLFMLSLNLAAWMLQQAGVAALMTGSPELLAQGWNATEIVETWSWPGTGSIVGDVMSGLRFLWTRNVPLLESMLAVLSAAGCPAVILEPLRALWRFLCFIFVIEFISGRNVTGE